MNVMHCFRNKGIETESIIKAQKNTIDELQEFVTRENKDREKIKELRWIIGGLQEEILKLRKEAKHG